MRSSAKCNLLYFIQAETDRYVGYIFICFFFLFIPLAATITGRVGVLKCQIFFNFYYYFLFPGLRICLFYCVL